MRQNWETLAIQVSKSMESLEDSEAKRMRNNQYTYQSTELKSAHCQSHGQIVAQLLLQRVRECGAKNV